MNIILIAILACILVGCEPNSASRELKMGTTTSTQNSGLLDFLLPEFEKKTDITVHPIPQGTGKALKSGELGNVDIVFVHAKKLEDKFVADGYGIDRRAVMHNDFVIVGPADNPAGLKGSDAISAFKRIAEEKALFCSRGDESGTHFKEKEIWEKTGLQPSGRFDAWYNETGGGMGATLRVADEMGAYTLADRSTYVNLKDKLKLKVLVEGDKILFNPYSIIAVNPGKHSNVNYKAAKLFIDWITSREGQKLIGKYRKGGEQLFYPDAASK